MAVRTAKAGLLVHTFGAVAHGPALTIEHAAARGFLPKVWAACGSLGIVEPSLAGVPPFLSETPSASRGPGFVVLSAARRPSDEQTFEAYTFGFHDVVGCTVALASNRSEDGIETWRERWEEWSDAIGPEKLPEGLLGQSLVFIALGSPADPSLAEEVGRALDPCGIEIRPESAFQTQADFASWEGSDPIGRRIVVVVAPAPREEVLDRSVWWQGGQQLAPLTRYLLHGAKLKYEEEVFLLRREDLRESGVRVETILGNLVDSYKEPWQAGARAAAEIVDEQRILGIAQAEDTGLIWQVSQMRELRRTVDIADGNLRALARTFGFDDSGNLATDPTMFGRDLGLATWLSQQIDHEIGYSEAITERAAQVYNLTSLRLRAAADDIDRRRGRLDLFRTVLLGSLLTALGLISTFGISLSISKQLALPLLAVIVAVLIGVPLLTSHWHERYGGMDWISAGLIGVATGWFIVVVAWPGHQATWPYVVLAAGAGMLLVPGLLWFAHDGRRWRLAPGRDLG